LIFCFFFLQKDGSSVSERFAYRHQGEKSGTMETFNRQETSQLCDFLTRKPRKLKRSKSDFELYKKIEKQLETEQKKQKKSQSSSQSARLSMSVKQDSDLGDLFKRLANTSNISEQERIPSSKDSKKTELDYNQLDLDRKYIDMRLYVNNNAAERPHKRPHRLPPLTVKVALTDHKFYVRDLAHETKFYSENIQLLKFDAHERLNKASEASVKKKNELKTIDRRFFQKAYGNMSLGCLKAVDKAYADRNNTEKQNMKAIKVRNQRDNQDIMKKNIQFYRDERLREVQKLREQEKVQLEVQRRRLNLNKIQVAETVQETKKREHELNVDRRKDILVAIDFNKQHLSVSKALEKHEFGLFRDEMLKSKLTNVTKWRTQRDRQHNIIKRFLNLRNMKRTVENKKFTEQVKTNVHNRENYRLFIAKNRVHFVNASKHIIADAIDSIKSTIDAVAADENPAGLASPRTKPMKNLPKIAFRSMKSILDQLSHLEYEENANVDEQKTNVSEHDLNNTLKPTFITS
jgi:hypothetical protein